MSKTDSLKTLLKEIKKLPCKTANVNLYLGLSRAGQNRKGVYKISRVNRDETIANKLREGIVRRIEQAKEVRAFEPVSEDQDDAILVGQAADTEWSKLAQKITEAHDKETPKLEDLIGANFYIVELVLSPHCLYAVTRLKEKWTAKRTTGLQTIFRDGKLIDVENGTVFRFESGIDFISYKDSFLILNKRNFEQVLNHREGMIRARDEVLDELGTLNKFEGLEMVREQAGDKIPYLRRLCSIRKAGFFREADFMEKLFEVVQKFGWDIEFSKDGKIIITPENMETVLHLLNNDRVRSVIDQRMFDAIVKKEVNGQ